MDAKKVKFGCLVGVPFGLLVAVIFTPLFWWLGVLAGFSAGYFVYDLRQVLAKSPLAWKRAKRESRDFLNWFKKPRPFLYPFLIIGVVLIFSSLKFIWTHQNLFFVDVDTVPKRIFATILLSTIFTSLIDFILLLLMIKSVEIGAEKKRRSFNFPSDRVYLSREKGEFEAVSYRNIYGFMPAGLVGLIWIGAAATSKILRFIFCGVWILIGRFVWHLVKLIHLQGRIICGMDCALGVFATYKLLGPGTETASEFGLLLAFGAVIGWTFGHIHCKIAQLTGLAPITNNLS